MNNNILNEELKQKLIEKAIEGLDDPWKNLTVKDVAEDLKMGPSKASEIFKREDFPSVNIGKTRTVTAIAYYMWKLERRKED